MKLSSTSLLATLAAATLALTGCVAGESTEGTSNAGAGAPDDGGTLNIDFATYNPLSLVIKEHGWLQDALAKDGISVNWLQSHGSNKANEALRAGAIDVGSTAGSAALLARANGSPIQTIYIYSQPEWSALVVPAGSDIQDVPDVVGQQIAATKGTDPYFFLLQTLNAHGVDLDDVTVQNLQHADGWSALANGSVDAWAGLDPIMAAAEEEGAELVYRNVDFNTYGFLNANESFLTERPEVAQTVVDVYEYARAWSQENHEETVQILADVSGIETSVAEKVIERTNLAIDPAPGEAQRAVLERIGPDLVETGDVRSQDDIDTALAELLNDDLVRAVDLDRVAPQ